MKILFNHPIKPNHIKGWYIHKISKILGIFGIIVLIIGYALFKCKTQSWWTPEYSNISAIWYTAVALSWGLLYAYYLYLEEYRMRVKIAYTYMVNDGPIGDRICHCSKLSRQVVESVYNGQYEGVFLGIKKNIDEIDEVDE